MISNDAKQPEEMTMAMSINTNMGSLRAQQSASNVSNDMQQAMNRLSTGQRINSASDDAAGSAIASRLTSEIRGTNQAIRNALDSQALIDTAEGAQQEVENILQRMRELAVQSANDTNSDSDRANIQLEIDQLATELDRIAVSTTWGGKQLLNGSAGDTAAKSFSDATNFKFQIGGSAKASDSISVSMGAISSQALGVGSSASSLDVSGINIEAASGDVDATMSFENGTLSILNDVAVGDKFEIDINDVTITVTVAASDGFADTNAGVAALLKQKLEDAQITQFGAGSEDAAYGVDVVDNGDGTLTFTQSGTPIIDAQKTNASNAVSVDGSKISITGTYAAADTVSVDINGTTIKVTAAASNEYADSNIGLASQLADAIRTDGIGEFVDVIDNGDGTLNILQSTTPKIDNLTTTVSPTAVNSLTESAGTVTVAGAVTEGREYTLDIMGETISVTASLTDSYSNDITGIAEQLSVAINAAGISGVTASASSGAITVNTKPVFSDVSVSSDAGTTNTADFTNSSGTLTLYGTKTTKTASTDTWDVGDVVSFTLDGNDFEVTVGTDGYSNTNHGVAHQIAAAIKDFDNSYTVTTGTANTVVVARTATNFISNLSVADPSSSLTYSDATFTVGEDIAVGDVFNFSMEGKDFSVTAADTSATSVAALITDAINDAGFSEIVAKDNSDGTVSISGGGVDVSTANGAIASIVAIDNAMSVLAEQRSTLGSITNRIDSTVRNMTNVVVNLEGGRGRIEDADFALESSNLAKSQILNQAATAMLAQANASQQSVLSLLQG